MWKTMWGKLIGMLIGALVIALVGGAITHLTTFWEVKAAGELATKAIVEIREGETKHQESLDAILDVLKGMQVQYEEIKVIILTPEVVGRATVGDFGFDDAFVDINERGNASMYLKADSIMVTYSMNGTELRIQLPVRGSFRSGQDSGHLVILSAKAGSDLGIAIGTIIDRFTVGPVK